MRLVAEEQDLAICRLPAASPLPEWLPVTGFRAVTWTADETSVVCEQSAIPAEIAGERDWRALRVVGPIELGLTGVISSIARPLAEAAIPIFAVSTFDTDYVLVQRDSVKRAVSSLRSAGHEVTTG